MEGPRFPAFFEALTPYQLSTWSTRMGLVVFKPDAFNLGVVEHLIEMVCNKLHDEKGISRPLLTAGIVSGQVGIMKQLYPDQWVDLQSEYPDSYEYMNEYLERSPIVVAAFRGNGKFILPEYLKMMRGTRLDRVDFNDKSKVLEFGRTIRGMVPVPGTPEDLSVVVKHIRTGTLIVNDRISSSNPQIGRAVQENLVHVPETWSEIYGATSLLDNKDKNRVMNYLEQCFRESPRKSP